MNMKALRKIITTGICAGIFCISACSPNVTPVVEDVKVTSIDFITEISSVYVNFQTYITGVRVLPENATNKEISWSVKDPSIAEITDKGDVKGLKAGVTKLIATAKDGSNVNKEVDFTVKPLEKPSSWKLENFYSFYYTEEFTPELEMYPDSIIIDKTATFEIIEGNDVLKLENGKIGANKPGEGIVKVTSNANPELVGEITCIADDDLITKYGIKETSTGSEAHILREKYDRKTVLDFKGEVKKDGWPIMIMDFKEVLNSKNFIFTIDSRMMSGDEWYSIRLAKDGVPYAASETNCDSAGGKPKLNSWTNNTFDFTNFDYDFNQIIFCINCDPLYQKGKTDKYTEILFDNLKFENFVDAPTALTIKESEVLLPINKTSDIEVEFTPKYVKNRELIYSVKPGSENIVSVENGKVKGLSKGKGYVEVVSKVNPNAKATATVVVSDEQMIALELIRSDVVVKKYIEKEGKESVVSLSAPSTPGEAWIGAYFKLPNKALANKISISVDAKMLSGYEWFSITLFSNNAGKKIQEIGCGEASRNWKTYTFDFTENQEADSLCFMLNTWANGTSCTLTELLFTNLGINIK